MSQLEHDDILSEKYMSDRMITLAHHVLNEGEQSEEDFLGAKGILMLNGLL